MEQEEPDDLRVDRITDVEFYEILVQRRLSYQWVGHHGECIDLRKVGIRSIKHLEHILGWMDERHSDNTPFRHTLQYRYIKGKLYRFAVMLDLANKVLKRKDIDGKL